MKGLIAAALRKLGMNKGAPRLYLDGTTPIKAGFQPGMRYSLVKANEGRALVLRLAEGGDRVVSRKERAGKELPIIDLNSVQALEAFAGMEQVRVLIGDGEIWILPLASEARRVERIKRMREEVATGTVSTAGVCTGMGVLSNAMHAGLKRVGLKPRLRWAVEIDAEALEQAQAVNDAWDKDTLCVAMPLQEVGLSDEYVRRRLSPVTVLEAGLPCTAASTAGRAKKKLAQAEDDGKAGHLVAGFLALLAQANPAVMVLENVVPYFSSGSAAILRSQLADMGYDVEERTIEGKDFAIEARVRKVMVAVTRGAGIMVDELVPPHREVQTVGSILDDVPLDAACWSEMGYLKEKEVRDIDAGKGFRMAVAQPGDSMVGTIGTGYQKNRSTEPKVPHPENANLLRLFTPAEHARLKGVPERLIEGIDSATRAHAFLGQSVIWPAFKTLGEVLGNALVGAVPANEEASAVMARA